MTSKRKIITYWFLLLVPTIILVGIGYQLILHEQERINKSAVSTLSDRAKAISETIHITIADLESELTASLVEIPESDLKETLLLWAETNPIVRNVFIWSKEGTPGLQLPADGMESTGEERQFIKRYDALFSSRVPWQKTLRESLSEFQQGKEAPGSSESVSDRQYTTANTFTKKIDRLKTERRNLLKLAKAKSKPESSLQQSPSAVTIPPFQKQSGWIPWFAENRLFLLGWVKTRQEGPRFGVELELIAILSRIVTELPEINSGTSAYSLIGGNGQILHQSGSFPINKKQQPVITLPVSELLPHWKISVYLNKKGHGANKGFIYISCLLLGIFVIAIISGGALLTLQAQRNLKDAALKTSFVSSVSHELKTPLTSIRMYAELLQTGRMKKPEKVNHYLSVIVTESQRLTRLVNNVLDFGRLEEGKKKYHPDTIDLPELLHSIITNNQFRIEQSGLDLDVFIPEKKLPVTIDRDAIEQVLLNLIDNAIKYAGKGKKLIIEMKESDPQFYEITLRDFGPGVPAGQTEKIFEKFHRVDNSLTSRQPGSGLGLSIARRILRDLDGDLLYKPGETHGSCFIIKIRKN